VNTPQHTTRRIVVAITGASGAVYAQRLITELVRLQHETHVVTTSYGRRLLHDELGLESLDLNALASLPEDADPRQHNLIAHPAKDVGASLGSGSFRHDGLVVLPCSSNTLGAIASGNGDQLVYRAAAVALKERLPLILCHRESPLNLIDIENMRKVTLAGAIVAPTNPGFYYLPSTIHELVDFVVARVLDLLHIPHNVSKRWSTHLAEQRDARDEARQTTPGRRP
jgi:4-hydroxy-3-polyprenylbenzoate decarboxylase